MRETRTNRSQAKAQEAKLTVKLRASIKKKRQCESEIEKKKWHISFGAI